jgi:type I restriction enzyme S subunit
MKFKPYPKYKDSGIEWLGEIPNEWAIKRLGHISAQEKNAFVDGPFGSDLKTDDYKDDGIPLIQLNNIKEGGHILQNMKFITEAKKEQLRRHIAKFGDVVIAKMADPVARATLVNRDYEEYVIVADCVKLTPDKLKINGSFLIYSINSRNVRTGAELVSTGTTRIRINLTELKKLWIPYPPIQEQTTIANFLDSETSRIDALVEEKKRFIELLKEKRLALISHAVTKGLNPTVKMKDVGIDWLGEVPEYWKISKLKFETSKIIDGTHFTPTYVLDGVPFLRVTDIQTININLNEVKRITEKEHKQLSKRCKPSKGDVLLSKNGTIGIIKIIDWDWEFSIFVSLCLLKFKERLNNRYFSLFFDSDVVNQQISESSKKTSVTNLHLDKIKELIISIPPIQEQIDIANYLGRETGKIDALITETQVSIELLKEHRTALISAAVTGKIDVREAA